MAVLRPDWSGVDLWWVDERVVPPADGNSNYRLIRESLLDGLARGPEVHRVQGELPPGEAADEYDAELEGVTLAFALMGIGPDGHTASLFPNAPALEITHRRAVAVEAGMEPHVPRVQPGPSTQVPPMHVWPAPAHAPQSFDLWQPSPITPQ